MSKLSKNMPAPISASSRRWNGRMGSRSRRMDAEPPGMAPMAVFMSSPPGPLGFECVYTGETHQLIHLRERQQRRRTAGAGSGCLQVRIRGSQGAGRGEEPGAWEKRDLVAH